MTILELLEQRCFSCQREIVGTQTATLADCTAISFFVGTSEGGNKVMSYHAQQNTQQKTFGLFIVFAFHVVLIWAVMNGLGVGKNPVALPNLQPRVIEEHKTVDPVIPPTDPVIVDRSITFTKPDKFDFDQPPIAPPVIGKVDGGTGGDIITSREITKPTIRKVTKPDYPSASARLEEAGTTGLQLYIAADGRVTDAQVFKSSGFPRLDTAAVKHVIRSWTFNPCTEDGKAVACAYKTNLTWKLEDAAR